MFDHACLDANGICIGYGSLTNIEVAPNLVYLPDGWDEDLKWRKYENGQWSAEKFITPIPPPEPDSKEEIKQLKSRQADILMAMVMNDLM